MSNQDQILRIEAALQRKKTNSSVNQNTENDNSIDQVGRIEAALQRKKEKFYPSNLEVSQRPLGTIDPEIHEGFMRGAKSALHGALNFGRGLHNFPHTVASTINPDFGKYFSYMPEITYEEVGLQNPTGMEQFVSGVTGEVPYFMGNPIAGASRAARIGEQALRSGAHGFMQGEDPMAQFVKEALLGAGMQAIPEAATPLIRKGVQGLANFIEPYAGKTFVGELEKTLKRMTGQETYGQAAENMAARQLEASSEWKNTVTDFADKPFNYEPFVQMTESRLEKMSLPKFSGHQVEEKPAQEFLELIYENDLPLLTDLSSAIDFRQSLNKHLGYVLPKSQKEVTKNMIMDVANDFKSFMGQELESVGRPDLFAQWEKANKLTQSKHQDFDKVMTARGKETPSIISNLSKNKSPYVDESILIKDYLPKSGEEGIDRFIQLEKVMGAPEKAREALVTKIFDKSLKDGAIEPKLFLDKFSSLSQQQQNHLFNPEQIKTIETLKHIQKLNPKAFEANDYLKNIFFSAVGLGSGAATATTLGPIGGALIGGVGALAPFAKKGAEKLSENKILQDAIMRRENAVLENSHITENPLVRALLMQSANQNRGNY